MMPQIKQRWKYRDTSPYYDFIVEVTSVNSDGTFSAKVVSCGSKSGTYKGQSYFYLHENNWDYLLGQDAP